MRAVVEFKTRETSVHGECKKELLDYMLRMFFLRIGYPADGCKGSGSACRVARGMWVRVKRIAHISVHLRTLL